MEYFSTDLLKKISIFFKKQKPIVLAIREKPCRLSLNYTKNMHIDQLIKFMIRRATQLALYEDDVGFFS